VVMEPDATKNSNPEKPLQVNQELMDLLNQLPVECRDERGAWWYITKCVKSLGADAETRRTWDAWSKQSAHYNSKENARMWDDTSDLYDVAEAKSRLDAKASGGCDLVEQVHKLYCANTDEDFATFLVSTFGKYWRTVDLAKNDIWMYNMQTALWMPACSKHLNSFLTEHFGPIRDRYLMELNANPTQFIPREKDVEDSDYKKTVQKHVAKVMGSKSTRVKNGWINEFFGHASVHDALFDTKLDANRDVLSVKNGVVDLRTGKLRERRFDDYMTTALDIEYDADKMVDVMNPDFLTFMNGIFDSQNLDTTAVVNFMQGWLGYSLTGHTTEQKCLILFGGGSNGKSVLNRTLASVLKCSAGRVVDEWNSKLFDDKASNKESANQASPELARLAGVRLGIINETSEGLTFGEMMKKLVDSSDTLSYRPLHKSSKTMRLTTKFMFSTNHFPNFPVDEAFVRRFLTVPMLMRFCAEPDPEKPTERGIDYGLFEKMTGTVEKKQAILNWMVEGAMRYYANGMKIQALPPCCQVYKDQYIKNNDWRHLFTVTGEPTDYITFEDVFSEINQAMSSRSVSRKEITDKLKEMGAVQGRKRLGERGRLQCFVGIKPSTDYEEVVDAVESDIPVAFRD